MNKKFIQWIDEFFYKDFRSNWDNKIFRQTIIEYINEKTIMLDLGAGAGIVSEMNFKGKAKKIIGVDPDKRVLTNKFLDQSFVSSGENLDFIKSSSIDVVICNNVLEHIKDPDRIFQEVHRILKPGGLFITKTPNKFHYVTLIARITPDWFHEFYNKLRGRKEDDTYPTLYKVNSINTQNQIGKKNGFDITKLESIEGRPEYLRIFFIFYFFGLVYERLVNFFKLKNLKVILITIFKKNI